MQTVQLPGLGTTSVIGFGCGALGGRLGPRDSLRLLGEAAEHGITHLDVARSYGYGRAEEVVGRFLRGRRDGFTVVSKAGVRPPTSSPARRVVVGAAREALKAAPALRAVVSRRANAEVREGAFSVTDLESSLTATLRALRTDHLDALLLHECRAEDLTGEVREWVEEVVVSGRARRWGVATSAERAPAVLDAVAPPWLNMPSSTIEPHRELLEHPAPRFRALHSVLSQDLAAVERALAEPGGRRRWAEELGMSVRQDHAADLLVRAARSRNPHGTVLVATQRVERVAGLAAAGGRPAEPALSDTMARLLLTAPRPPGRP